MAGNVGRKRSNGKPALSSVLGQKYIIQYSRIGVPPIYASTVDTESFEIGGQMQRLQPFGKLTGDVTGTIVREQTWFAQNRRLVTARSLHRQIQRVGDIAGLHRRAQLPGNDVSAVIIQNRRQIEPALQISEVGLPELVRPRCLVLELVCGRQNHIGRAGDQIVGLEDAIDRSL